MDAKKPYVVPHTGKDCVSIKRNGVHVAFACYMHAQQVISLLQAEDLEDGLNPDLIDYSRWGIKLEAYGVPIQATGIECCIK